MIIDATFWVAISFLIFIILLIFFKIPSKVKNILDENINQIKKQVDESEKLKEEAKRQLAEYEKRIGDSKSQVNKMIKEANNQAEKNIIKSLKSLSSDITIISVSHRAQALEDCNKIIKVAKNKIEYVNK